MKRTLRTFSAVAVLCLCGATVAFAGIRKGPYLMFEGANTAMTVLWQDDVTESNVVRWGTDTNYTMGQATVAEYGTDHQHKYAITGLQPNTKYFYQVDGYGSGSFRTAPASTATSTKIIAYGDTRSYPASQESVVSRIRSAYATDPAYQSIVLNSGDMVSSDGESYWTSEWFVSGSSYPQMHAFQAEAPQIGVRGNHEGTGTSFLKYFPFPYVSNFYWSFDYGPAHIIVLDQYATYTSGSAQYNWLVNDLASTTKPWKIVTFHEPAWGAGTHANNTTTQNVLHPLFKQYGVDLIVNGHNHNYARAVAEGKNYVTAGGGGAPLYTPDPAMTNVVKTDQSYHYCEINIQDSNLTMTARRADGTVIETLNLAHGTGNQPPVANAGPDQSVTDTDGNGSQSVTLNGSASSDPDGTISSYVWKEGATQIATGATPAVTLAVGTHTITLTVTDNAGATATDTMVATVNAAGGSTTVTSQVNASNDDVEERQTGGTMYNSSSDLELVYDTSTTGNQYVGMRFNSVNVPKGKTITNAYIQFTVDETGSTATSLTVKGQAADNPGTFTTAAYNVSSRAKTTASVAWSPVAWNTIDAAGVDQRTPDLKNIVQEIVNRTGWAQNNSMVFIVTGTGKRTARAYDVSATKAPKLVITYQ
ncbi:MAG: metallophosphoesterase [Geobacter sp.]|nr:metallophosphoesterase [Geobacter sp.]